MSAKKIEVEKVSVRSDKNKNPFLDVSFTISIADNDLTSVFTRDQMEAIEKHLSDSSSQVKFAMDCLGAVLEYKRLTHSEEELADIAKEFGEVVFGHK